MSKLRKTIRCCGSLVIIFILPQLAQAGSDGGYAGAFLRMGLGARALGLGNAFVAVADDGFTSYYNPAGLSSLTFRQIITTFSFLSFDRKLNYIAYAQSVSPKIEGKQAVKAGFAVGWIHSGVDNIDGRDLNGRPTGTLSNAENAFYFSFALNPFKLCSFGLSAKVLYNRFPRLAGDGSAMTAKGFGMDFGVLFKPSETFSFGASIRDWGSKYTWNTEKLWEKGTTTVDRFPKVFTWGLAYKSTGEGITAALDFEKNEKQRWRYHLGFEITSAGKIVLRGGLNNGDFSFGAGLKTGILKKMSEIDYAYTENTIASRGDHTLSWYFLF